MKHTKGESKNNETKQSEELNKVEFDQCEFSEENLSEEKEKPKEEVVTEEMSELDSAKNTIDGLQSKLAQLNDTYLRTLAEYDNYRKRTLKEKADLIKTGGESVLINILTVVDDVERGISSSKNAQDIEALREGLELIQGKFVGFLKQNGIKEMETEGEAFDCDRHEAIATVPAPEESLRGKIIDCVQKGYFLHDKVIRFAKVVVGE